MPVDHRINSTPFTCQNRFFETKPEGHAHGTGRFKGSVFAGSLYSDDVRSLWLEHVRDRRNPDREAFWFMWYDAKGYPEVPLSGVFDRMAAEEIARQMGTLLP